MNTKTKDVRKICWQASKLKQMCTVGFFVDESSDSITIASTIGVGGKNLDVRKIKKDTMLTHTKMVMPAQKTPDYV